MQTIQIAIFGAAGRMGCRLIAVGSKDIAVQIVAALDSPQHPQLGRDAGTLAGIEPIGVPLTAALPDHVQPAVLIDFSTPAATDSVIELCRSRNIPLVFATTGLSQPQDEAIVALSKQVPVLRSASMSMAVIVAMKLAEFAAETLRDKDADVEIIEKHHRFKADAPSGTALTFGGKIAAIMQQSQVTHGRNGHVGKRPSGEIGYHAVRVGDNPGEHTVLFGMLGETLEITVKASNRDCYATGAFAAAKFLVGKPPKLYSMNDVLGLG